ncbi:hypothetical protein OsJ_30676 [Oryza sativa Japonica Group]|uniref:Uncharacterized protein n=1 Tax=Oryza sativa subsp. japonica TaxID=39947 RepID=B9G7G6_ORYSJ|nr:hypothetical protein OsJ_30676 [Oryza sativa Japonica Group]
MGCQGGAQPRDGALAGSPFHRSLVHQTRRAFSSVHCALRSKNPSRTEAASSSSSATLPAVLRPPPHRLLCASSFAQALLRSFDAVVNHLQAALDATDAAAASLLRDHAALDDGNTRLGARLDRTLASNLIVLIQAHAEKSKVKCQESQPSKAFNGCKQPLILRELTMDFQWVQGTIDSEGTDRGHVEGG